MNIPIAAITEAKNALTAECISLREALDRNSLIALVHRKRITERVLRIESYVAELDAWLKELGK